MTSYHFKAALIFQKSLNISQTSRLHDGMVVYENHTFSNGIVSQINVSVDAIRHYKYVFSFQTMDHKICKRLVKPKFEGTCATWTDHLKISVSGRLEEVFYIRS